MAFLPGAFVIPFLFFEIFTFSLRRARAARGPYFLLLQKVGKDRRKGVSPPCESPDQSGVLDAPLWKPPSPRWRGKFGRTPRRLRGWSFGAVGEGRERLRARHDCRTSTASGWGLHAPLPPAFPVGEHLPVTRTCWSCAPWPAAFPKGKSPPIMRASAWDRVRNGFAGNAPANLPEAPAAQRLGVPSLSSRGCAEGTLARPQGGIPKGAQPSLASLCLLSAGQKVGARRGPSASKEETIILKKGKGDQ